MKILYITIFVIRKQFLNPKNSKTRILVLESIPTMRNPPDTQIVTHTQIVTPFLGLRKCDYLEPTQ